MLYVRPPLKRLIRILEGTSDDIKKLEDQYKLIELQNSMIGQFIDEILGGKVIVKMSNVKFFGSFLDFSSLTCLSKHFGGLK